MQSVVKIFICVLISVKMVKCCNCNLEEMIKDTVLKSTSSNMEKRQMSDDEEDFSEDIFNSVTTEGTTKEVTKATSLATKARKVAFRGSVSPNAVTTTKPIGINDKDECLFSKDIPVFDIDKMVDVWKIAFYKATEKLSCFKIHIKKTSVENRKVYHDSYGDFNGTIDWSKCIFEVTSSIRKSRNSDQRHFLQGPYKMGVFKNIIVTKEETGDLVTLLEQSPDQWLVVSHLLLMRDCDNGDVVVFARLPMIPAMRDIEDALAVFGEDAGNGTLACETLRNPKYHTLS